VDWSAYKTAIGRLPRAHRISITKMSHQLWNTNEQNHKYYGQSASCPYCQSHKETLPHVFTCTHQLANHNRTIALEQLQASLRAITPVNLFDCILFGLTQWIAQPTLPTFIAPTEGSILPQLASLTVAFRQQCDIGWPAFLRGHIAIAWRSAYCKNYQQRKNAKPPAAQTLERLSNQWCNKLIHHLWSFSKTIWKSRNEVVHGLTNIAASKETLLMQEKVRSHYHNYAQDPHYVLNHQGYLFSRPIDQTLTLRRDTMACWLHTVDEAILTRIHNQQYHTRPLETYFEPRRPSKSNSSSIWNPPFSKNYYVKHHCTIPVQKQRRTPRVTPAYRHPVRYRCHTKIITEPKFERPTRTAVLATPIPSPTPIPKGKSNRNISLLHHPQPLYSRRHCQNSQRNRRHRSSKQESKPPTVTLTQLGFHRIQQAHQSNLTRRQLDKLAQRTDYSGTYVSTVP